MLLAIRYPALAISHLVEQMSELTQEYLKLLFVYDPETGNFIHNPARPRETFKTRRGFNVWRGQHAGRLAGCAREDGYIILWCNNRLYLAHRMAWLYAYGEMPEEEIDHIDGDPSNNSIKNLRKASHAQNCKNVRAHVDGKIPYRGVHEHTPGRYRASIYSDGENTHLGLFDTPEEAALAYDKAAIKLHEDFSCLNFPAIHVAPPRKPRLQAADPGVAASPQSEDPHSPQAETPPA